GKPCLNARLPKFRSKLGRSHPARGDLGGTTPFGAPTEALRHHSFLRPPIFLLPRSTRWLRGDLQKSRRKCSNGFVGPHGRFRMSSGIMMGKTDPAHCIEVVRIAGTKTHRLFKVSDGRIRPAIPNSKSPLTLYAGA